MREFHYFLILTALFTCALIPVLVHFNRQSPPTIFVITPTYNRTNQQSELVRLCTVFTMAGHIHWIVVEDANKTNPEMDRFLKECGLPYTLLYAETSPVSQGWIRGTAQRNAALKWLRSNYKIGQTRGVVFFGDDDNTYHPDLFKEMWSIKRGGTWPVGFVAKSLWDGCITHPNNRNKISGFFTLWNPGRKFPLDMAAFAVNLDVVLSHPNAYFNDRDRGIQEGVILEGLGFKDAYELEPKANGCTRLLAWHSKAVIPTVESPPPNTIVGLL